MAAMVCYRNKKSLMYYQKTKYMERKICIKRIGLFEAYSREDQNESSDIDVLVEFKGLGLDLDFDQYIDLKFDLEDHFHKPVDLVIVDDIKPALKQSILRSAKFTE